MQIDPGDLISVSDANSTGLSKLREPEELADDMRLSAITLARIVTDSGERISLADAAASFGIDLDELATDED